MSRRTTKQRRAARRRDRAVARDWFFFGHCPMYPGEPRCVTVEQTGDCDDHGCADRIRSGQ